MNKIFTLVVLATFLFISPNVANAASITDMVAAAAVSGDMKNLQDYIASNPSSTDEVIKALLKFTQDNLASNPDKSAKMMEFAAAHAPEITPPSVPAICADVRRIVASLPVDAIGTPLFTSVLAASQSFAKAPVVAAAGRPKLCEEAVSDILLAQQPGYIPPTLPPEKRKPSGE